MSRAVIHRTYVTVIHTVPWIQAVRQVAFGADQTPRLRTKTHCLTQNTHD